jgi:hypothetical protein
MVSSGTYNYLPNNADLSLDILSRIGVRGPAITADHLLDLHTSANLVLGTWSNRGLNLWEVDLQVQPLTQGVATYPVLANTVGVLDIYIRTNFGGVQVDRPIRQISRTDYANQPNKDQQAPPTVIWFNRQLSPTMTFWQTPDGNGPYEAQYYRMRETQDFNLLASETADLGPRFTLAFVSDVAADMAIKYPPAPPRASFSDLRKIADLHWQLAMGEDTEYVSMQVRPNFSPYFR